MPQRDALVGQMRVHPGEDRFGQPVTLQQMAKVEDRPSGLARPHWGHGPLDVRNALTAQFDPGKAPHRLAVMERSALRSIHWSVCFTLEPIRHRVAQCVPILKKVDPQHRPQRHWRTPALRAGLGIMRRDQPQQPAPRHHRVRRCARTNGACASLSARNCSRRVTCFFIASRRLGKAGCLGIDEAPRGVAIAYQIRQKTVGFSGVP